MIDRDRIRGLPLDSFRQELLECQACFSSSPGCKHHEDVLGGYGEGRIVVIGLNPQAPVDHPIYTQIQRAPWHAKRALSDNAFKIYSGEKKAQDVHAGWTWQVGEHPGFRRNGWLSLVEKLFDLRPRELEAHFSFLETFKHATANKSELHALAERSRIQENCPTWAKEQIRRLKPRLIIFCGDDSRQHVAPHFFGEETYRREIAAFRITFLHGKKMASAEGIPTLFTIGLSGQNRGRWAGDSSGTASVRGTVREAIADR